MDESICRDACKSLEIRMGRKNKNVKRKSCTSTPYTVVWNGSMQRDGSAPGLSTGGRSGLDPSFIETMGERGGIAGMMTGAPMRLGKSGRRGSD